MQASDYTQNAPVTALGYTAFTYSPVAALVTAGRSGRLTTNRDGFSTTYTGLEATLNKRLSNKWMARVAFTYGDWTKNQDLLTGENGNPTRIEEDNLVDGDQVALRSGGSGKGALYYTVRSGSSMRTRSTSCPGGSTSRARPGAARADSSRSS